jgi:hypothetical protein
MIRLFRRPTHETFSRRAAGNGTRRGDEDTSEPRAGWLAPAGKRLAADGVLDAGSPIQLAHITRYGYAVSVKTTVEISDALLLRAKRHARKVGRPLRALIEDGLRHVLHAEHAGARYHLADVSVGDPRGANPLESMSWQDLRDEIYGDR